MEKGTAIGDIAAGDRPSDLASSVPALILPTPDGPDPLSDLASSVPALSLPTPDGSALSDPTPDGFTPSHDDYFLPQTGWLESPDPSLRLLQLQHLPSLLLLLPNLRQMWLFPLFCNHNLIKSFMLLSLSLLSFTVT